MVVLGLFRKLETERSYGKAKRVSSEKRNSGSRKMKQVLLVSVEGNKNNKTERLYLSHFKGRHIEVRFVPGNETDPETMMKRLIETSRENDLDRNDMAACLIDSDFDRARDQVIRKVEEAASKSRRPEVHLIVSSPSFEIWYLCHFQCSTREYQNKEEVLADLNKYIPGYKKSADVHKWLEGKEKDAIKNAQQLEITCKKHDKRYHHVEFMPSTDMYKVLQWIEKNGGVDRLGR